MRSTILPVVSVVVPAFNAERTLPDCLKALASQEFPADPYEVLVIDNGSTDRTWHIIQSYGPPVRGLRELQIRGSYAARNKGVKASRAKIVAFTDADCIPDGSWLGELIKVFDDQKIGCVAGEIFACPATTPAQEFAAQQGLLSQKHTLNNSFRPYAQTANVAYRREVFDRIGLFDARLESGGDADFCWRMQMETAFRLKFHEQARVLHRHRSDWRGLWRQFKRYGRGAAALRMLYPSYKGGAWDNRFRWFVRSARLAARAAQYAIHRVLPAGSRLSSRESLRRAFYEFIIQTAFLTGQWQSARRRYFENFPENQPGRDETESRPTGKSAQ